MVLSAKTFSLSLHEWRGPLALRILCQKPYSISECHTTTAGSSMIAYITLSMQVYAAEYVNGR